jgi:hypothetical protein
MLPYRVKWAHFGIESSFWVGSDMLTDHKESKRLLLAAEMGYSGYFEGYG